MFISFNRINVDNQLQEQRVLEHAVEFDRRFHISVDDDNQQDNTNATQVRNDLNVFKSSNDTVFSLKYIRMLRKCIYFLLTIFIMYLATFPFLISENYSLHVNSVLHAA